MEMAAESLAVIESEVMRLRAGATAELASFDQQPQDAANFEQPEKPGASPAGDASFHDACQAAINGQWSVYLEWWDQVSIAQLAQCPATRRFVPFEARAAWASTMRSIFELRSKAWSEGRKLDAERLEKLFLALPRLLLVAPECEEQGNAVDKLAAAAKKNAALRQRFLAFGRAE